MSIYRGPCDELYGREIPDPPEHDCKENLKFKSGDFTETHGLECGPFEHWHEEWYECSICGEQFTTKQVSGEVLDPIERSSI